jgi:hypothetical protein
VKVHLSSSDEPLPSGNDQSAACGKTVPKAVFLFVFDMGLSGLATLSSLLCCQKCSKALGTQVSRRYLYGLGNGEEVLHDTD